MRKTKWLLTLAAVMMAALPLRAQDESCPDPSEVWVSEVGLTSVRITWNSTGATSYYVAMWHSGVLTDTTTTDTTLVLNGLEGQSTYSVYVNGVCSDGSHGTYGGYAYITTGCYDTIPWGVGINTGWCWTAEDSTWSMSNVGYPYIGNHDTMQSRLVSPWFEVPDWAANDPIGLVWKASTIGNAEVIILATTDEVTYDTLFHGLVCPLNHPYGSTYLGNEYTFTTMLDTAYAGQAVRLVFVHQSGSTLFNRTTTQAGALRLNVAQFQLRTVLHPVPVIANWPTKGYTHEPILFTAALQEGSDEGLTYSWYSELMDTTLVGDSVWMTYTVDGLDHVRLTVSNRYGSYEHSNALSITIYDCPVITAMPWIEDISENRECWRVVQGSTWTTATASGNPAFYGASGQAGVIASPQITLPSDTTGGLRFEWQHLRSGYSNTTYYVMATTSAASDLSAYDTLGSFSASSSSLTTKSVDLSAYAGQTIRVAFRRNSSGTNMYVAKPMILSGAMPLATIENSANGVATVGDTVRYRVHMQQGSDSGLVFNWQSTMVAAGHATMTATDSVLTVVYTTEGMDTLNVEVSNVYGSIALSTITNAFVCNTVSSFPWEEEFLEYGNANAYNACWQISGWTHCASNAYYGMNNEDGSYIGSKQDIMIGNKTGDYMISPAIEVPSMGVEHLSLWVRSSQNGNRNLYVAISTTGADSLAQFTDTVLSGLTPNSMLINRTVPLAPYAGQTIHVAIIKGGGGNNYTYIDRVAVDYDTLPKVWVAGQEKTTTDSATQFTAWITRGMNEATAYTWHSTQGGIITPNAMGDTMTIVYGAGLTSDTDTITVVASNAFGSDTAQTTIHVVDCTPALTLPWKETFADGIVCWYKPEGSGWVDAVPYDHSYYESHRYLRSRITSDTVNDWIMSKAIAIPADTNQVVSLFWQVGTTNANFMHTYEVLATAAEDYTDTANYTLLLADSGTFQGYTNYTNRRVSLSQYAGQTIHIAFRNRSVSWTSGSFDLLIDNVEVRGAAVPVIALSAPAVAYTFEDTPFDLSLIEGNTNGITYTWHSALKDSTWTATTMQDYTLRYTAGGTDTVSVVAQNAYGADTAVAIVEVRYCTVVDTFPFEEPFNTMASLSCWRTMNYGNSSSQTQWRTMSQGGTNYVSSMNTYSALWAANAWLVSPLLQIPADAQGLVLTLDVHGTSYVSGGNWSLPYLYFRVSTNGGTDTASFGQEIFQDYYVDRWETSTIPLDPFAGQEIRLAIVHGDGVSMDKGIYLRNFKIDYIYQPEVSLAAIDAYVGDSTRYTAQLNNCRHDSLSITWHSSLMQRTFTGTSPEWTIVYPFEGTDTITVIVSNAYGADTATQVITVGSHPLPQVTLTAQSDFFAYDTIPVVAQLNDCSRLNIAYSWHSTMASRGEATMRTFLTSMYIVYTTEGIDTITYIVSNAFGADTATLIRQVVNCNGVAIPYFEDFTNVLARPYNSPGYLPLCWENIWRPTSKEYAPHVVGSGSHHWGVDGSNSLMLLTGHSANMDSVAYVILPRTSAPLNRLTLSFWYAFEQANYGVLSLGYITDSTFHHLTDVTPMGNTGRYDTVSLAGIPATAERLAFCWANSSSWITWYIAYLDDISLYFDDGVQAPFATVDSLGATCVRLAWFPVSDSCTYHVQVDNIIDTIVADTTITLCGLMPNTAYTARIATLQDSDTSHYASVDFTTLCHIVDLPYFNDFESSDALACWQKYGSVSLQIYSGSGSYYGRYLHSGTHGLNLNTTAYTSNYHCVVATPVVDAPANELLVSFWASTTNTGSDFILEAGVLTTPGDTTSFLPLATCTLQPSADPVRYEFDTRGITATENVCIAFRYNSQTYATIVDDLSIEHITSCSRLRSINSYAIDARTAVVEWEADTASALPMSGVLITLSDLTDTTLPDTTLVATGSSYTFSGLALGHKYIASLAALCSGDTSVAMTTEVIPTANVCDEVSGSFSSGWFLDNCNRPYAYSQTLYPATLAASVDTLYGIAYHITSTSVEQYPSSYNTYSTEARKVDVYIGQTSASNLTAPISASNLTLAVQNFEFPVTDTGWVHINFTHPVPLDGVSNLIVTLDDNTGAIYGGVNFSHHTPSFGVCFSTSSGSYSYTQTYDPYFPSSFSYSTGTIQIPDIQLLGGCSGDRCLQPYAAVTNIDTHSVTLAWYQRGSETSWQVEYRHEADSTWLVSGTTTDTTYTISGLNASTGYRFRVVTICDTTLIPGSQLRARTLCAPVSVPYHQSFRIDYLPISESSTTGATCWQTGSINFLSQNRGLWNTHQNGDYIISPEINADLSLTQATIEANGTAFFLEYIKVGACDEDGSNLVWIDSIPLDGTITATVFFNTLTGNQRHIAIGGSYQTWTLYDVQVDYLPGCVPVHHVSLGQISDEEVTLHWPPINISASWAVFVDDSLAGITTDTSYHITDLSPATTYTFSVREICSAGDTAEATSLTLTTLCSSSLPWADNFDANDTNYIVPDCWYPIFRPRTGTLGSAYVMGNNSNRHIWFYDSYWTYSDPDPLVANFLCSPFLHNAGNDITVSFYSGSTSASGPDSDQYPYQFQAGVITNPADTATFIPLLTLPSHINGQRYQFSTAGLTLPEAYCIAFRAIGQGTCSIDSVEVDYTSIVYYTLTLTTADSLMGTVSGSGTYPAGTTVNIAASAHDGFHFTSWNDGDQHATREIVVNSNLSLTAYFAPDSIVPTTYTLTLFSNDSSMGTVSGSGTYEEGSTVTISALPLNGYHFLRWSDNDTHAVRQLVLTADLTLTAYFEADPTQSILDADESLITVRVVNTDILISGAQGREAILYTLDGRILARHKASPSADIHIDGSSLASGIYLVKIGTLPARRVLIVR